MSSSPSPFFDSLRQQGWRRRPESLVAGVASGLAERLHVDATIVRTIWLVFTLFTGVGAVVYALAWFFLPRADTGEIVCEDLAHARITVAAPAALTLGVIGWLTSNSGMVPLWYLDFYGEAADVLRVLGIIAAVSALNILWLWWLVSHIRSRRQTQVPPYAPAPTAAQMPTPSAPFPAQPFAAQPFAVPPAPGQPVPPQTFTAPPAPGQPVPPQTFTAPPAPERPVPPQTFPAPGPGQAPAGAAYGAPVPPHAPASQPHHPGANGAPFGPVPPFGSVPPQGPAAHRGQAPHQGSAPHQSPLPPMTPAMEGPGALPPVTPGPGMMPPPPARPVRPRRPGPHRGVSFAVLGGAVLAVAGWVFAYHLDIVGILLMLAGLAGSLTLILGVGILVSAAQRRRAGWMTGLAWVTSPLIAMAMFFTAVIPATALTAPTFADGRLYTWEDDLAPYMETPGPQVGGRRDIVVPTAAAGHITIDLRSMPADLPQDATIHVTLGVGDITVLVSEDSPVRVEATGAITTHALESSQSWSVDGNVLPLASEVSLTPDDSDWASLRSVTNRNSSRRWESTFFQETTTTMQSHSYPNAGQTAPTAGQSSPADSPAHGLLIDAVNSMGNVEVIVASDAPTWQGIVDRDVWIIGYWVKERGLSEASGTLPEGVSMSHPWLSAAELQQCLPTSPSILPEDGADGSTDDGETPAPERYRHDAMYPEEILSQFLELPSAEKQQVRRCMEPLLHQPAAEADGSEGASESTSAPADASTDSASPADAAPSEETSK